MTFSKILDYLCFLKPAVIPVTYFLLYLVQLQMLGKIIDRQINPTTAKLPQITICPQHETAKPAIPNSGTIFAGDGQPAMNNTESTLSLAQESPSVGTKTLVPPHPNFAGNMVDSIELDPQKSPNRTV
jgi:hypothetical protein